MSEREYRRGASPKIAQHLARHSSISLTFDVYTHIGLHDAQGALNALPRIPCMFSDGNQPENREALRTGTDDQPVESAYKPAYKELTETPYSGSAPMAMDGTEETLTDGNSGCAASSDKPMEMAHLGNNCHPSARWRPERPGFEPGVGVNPLRRFSKPLP